MPFPFSGRLANPGETDFYFEHMGENKRYHHYFPDFVIVKKTGEFYITEVKSEDEHEHDNETVEAKKKAVEKVQKVQLDKFRYNVVRVVYTSATR